MLRKFNAKNVRQKPLWPTLVQDKILPRRHNYTIDTVYKFLDNPIRPTLRGLCILLPQ